MKQPGLPDHLAKLAAIIGIVTSIELGRRKLIPDDFVAYGCVGSVALAFGFMILRRLD